MTPDERVVVSTPQYLRNLTTILGETPKKDVANYMLWRAARASIGFLNKEIREIGEEFAKNVTGRTAVPPRYEYITFLKHVVLPSEITFANRFHEYFADIF